MWKKRIPKLVLIFTVIVALTLPTAVKLFASTLSHEEGSRANLVVSLAHPGRT